MQGSSVEHYTLKLGPRIHGPRIHVAASFRAQVTLLSRSYLGWGFDPSYPGWRVFAEERPVVEESVAGPQLNCI